jgi:predicted MFS family arabinose efflux permease
MVLVVPLIWLGIRDVGVVRASAAGPPTTPGEPTEVAGRGDTLRDKRFWSIAGPFALAIAAQVGMMVYQVSYLLPLLGVGGTSVALVCTSAAAAGGRLVLSAVIDHLDQRPVAAITFASQAAAVTLMISMPGSPSALYLGSILFGLCMGNVVALPTLIVQREFAPPAFSMVLGLSTAIGQVAYSISPALLGAVRDLSGSYRPTLAVCIGLQAMAALLILRRPTTRPAKCLR